MVQKNMKVKIKNIDLKSKIERNLFMLLITFTLIQNLIDFNIGVITIKPLYIIVILLLFLAVVRQKITIPNIFICSYFVYIVLVSVICAIWFGVDRTLFNYIVGFILLIIFETFKYDFTYEDWILILRKVWCLFFVAIIINDLIQKDDFIYYFSNLSWMEHPYHNTIVTGGANIEASWLAIMSIFFLKSHRKWGPIFLSSVVSILYGSRAAILCDIIIVIIFVYRVNTNSKRKKLLLGGCMLVLIILLLLFVYRMGYLDMVIHRFSNIGSESGSMGRIHMWKNIPSTIYTYPFGVGLGNSIEAISRIAERSFYESNLHLLVIQMFIDTGIIGGVFYLSLWLKFLIIEIKNRFNLEISLFLIIYLIISFIQFSGGETIFFCILGIYLISKDLNKNIKKYKI